MKLIRFLIALSILAFVSYRFYLWLIQNQPLLSQIPYPQLIAGLALCLTLRKIARYPYRWIETFIHELIHALFAKLFGCKITAIKVNRDLSGHCQYIDKGMSRWQHTIVRLSPYCFPLLTVLWLITHYFLDHYQVRLGSWATFAFSFTLSFHAIMNYHQIHLKQSDLKKEGSLTALCYITSGLLVTTAFSLHFLVR